MGKNFCKIEGKWCKFCTHKKECTFDKNRTELVQIHRCPKREATRTIRLKDYIADANFDDVMTAMCKWWPDQNKNRNGYFDVWNHLQEMKAIKTNWFVRVRKIHEDERDTPFGKIEACDWLSVDGIDGAGRCWAIEFEPWKHWLGMNIEKTTLDILSKDEIIAAILFEMTFDGYEEKDVQSKWKEINDAIEDIKNNK